MLKPISNDKIIELYNQGFSQKDICKRYDVTITKVRRVLESVGCLTSNYKKTDKDYIKAISHLLYSGYSQKKISIVMDAPLTTVRDIVHKYNLTGVAVSSRKKQRKELIVTLYKNGKNKNEICKENKVQLSYVNSVLGSYGLYLGRKLKANRIAELYKSGRNYSEICREINTSYRTIIKVINERGVSREK